MFRPICSGVSLPKNPKIPFSPRAALEQIPCGGSGNGACGSRNRGEVKEERKDKLAPPELDKRIKEPAGFGNRKRCLLLERLERLQSALRGM